MGEEPKYPTLYHFLLYYLPLGVRLVAYSSGVFFWTIIDPYIAVLVPDSVMRRLMLLGISVIEFEIASWIVDRFYRPKLPPNLERGSREERIASERMIYQLLLFFAFDLVAVLFLVIFNDGFGSLDNFLGFLGGSLGPFLGFLQILGFGAVAASLLPHHVKPDTPQQRVVVAIFGCLCLIPGFVYIFVAARILF